MSREIQQIHVRGAPVSQSWGTELCQTLGDIMADVKNETKVKHTHVSPSDYRRAALNNKALTFICNARCKSQNIVLDLMAKVKTEPL